MPSDNILHSGVPSRTALQVATQRAVHQLLDRPLIFDDPLALRILGRAAADELREDPYAQNEPMQRGLRALVVGRSRLTEDEFIRAAAAGIRQFVVLGAGLDTFAYRNPFRALKPRIFEIDHPSTQRWKLQLLEEAGIAVPEGVIHLPVDFESETLAERLAATGFDTSLPACFSWLGVTMYLSEETMMALLRFVAGLPRGTSITFDYQKQPSTPIEHVINQTMREHVAALGEPMISAFEPQVLREKVAALGFCEVELWDGPLINARYFKRRADGWTTFSHLVCARI